MCWTVRVQFLAGARDFLYSTASRSVLGLSLVVKWPEHEADHAPPPSAEDKYGGTIPHSFMHLHGMVLN
jgi:hypothetical protein